MPIFLNIASHICCHTYCSNMVKDLNRILQNLILASGHKIVPEKTLIIFDEIQDCPKVINSMKYFCENAPQYHIACAGSLLGIALAKPSSFPVGKVNFMQIDPMTFTEFLLANGDENLASYLESVDTIEPIPDAFFNPLYEKLKMYYVTGGMPEPVLMWTKARDVSAMQEALSRLNPRLTPPIRASRNSKSCSRTKPNFAYDSLWII